MNAYVADVEGRLALGREGYKFVHVGDWIPRDSDSQVGSRRFEDFLRLYDLESAGPIPSDSKWRQCVFEEAGPEKRSRRAWLRLLESITSTPACRSPLVLSVNSSLVFDIECHSQTRDVV